MQPSRVRTLAAMIIRNGETGASLLFKDQPQLLSQMGGVLFV